MLTEIFLNRYAALLTQRYLAFEKIPSCPPPKPEKNKRYLLYIHVPFCEQLCPYCCFMRVKFEPSLASAYFDALNKEIENYYNLGYCFDSIYVGGGTPTIMPDKLAAIFSFIKSIWSIKQISIETNPDHLTEKILAVLRDIGTNRLSVGVQSFDNTILESIGRLEKYGSGQEIKQRLSSVVGMFDTLNIDMIFNFPNQTEEILEADIKFIKEIKADQVTYYPLMVSDSKRKEIAEKLGKISCTREKRLYRLLTEQLADTYNQESVWCFSNKKGLIDEYIVEHDEYVGVGPGCWGYINGTMYSNTFSIQQYISLLGENKSPVIAKRTFSHLERIRYGLLLKLLKGSVSVADMKEKFGSYFWFYLCAEFLFLFITRTITFRDNNIILTRRGRYYWVILMRTLFSIAGDYRQKRVCSDAPYPV